LCTRLTCSVFSETLRLFDKLHPSLDEMQF
jgi:hypothetical protein